MSPSRSQRARLCHAPALNPVKGNGEGDTLASVRTSRTYEIIDESAPGGKIDVERDDLAKGYEYGRTAVPIEQTDENVANLQTFAGMGLIGFVQKDKVCFHPDPKCYSS